MGSGARRLVASITGWVIVAIVIYVLIGLLITTLGFVLRFLIWAILLGALITLYLNLKSPPDT
jgi:hypothetical protein